MDIRTKGSILSLLKSYLEQSPAFLSGEAMSRALGVSRVSVWKHIQSLRALGYPIEISAKGYRLVSLPDMLHPWEFPGRESEVHFFDEIDSTMAAARRLAEKDHPQGTLVVADRQLEGRGRNGRTWVSEKGGLYFTLLLEPRIAPPLAGRILIASSLALARTLRSDYAVKAELKWPNDIMVGDRKVAGMLADSQTESDLISRYNLGIGINVNNQTSGVVEGSCSLVDILGRSLSRRDLLVAFLDELARTMVLIESKDLLSEWKSLSSTIGRRVRVTSTRGSVAGRAVDIDACGALVVEQEAGQRRMIFYGDCHHMEREGS
jgi:BirA family biotin operon repressor/biotin-[acetyl-CoA-carboxylase] ligase